LQPAVLTQLTSISKSDNIQLTDAIQSLLDELENHLNRAASSSNGVS